MAHAPERFEAKGPMAQHFVAYSIKVGGDDNTILVKGPTQAIPYPEIPILMELHGETSVFDVSVVRLAPRDAGSHEKQRMALKYGIEVVEKVYPGRVPRIEWYMPGEEPDFPDEVANAKSSRDLPLTTKAELAAAQKTKGKQLETI